MNKTYTHFRSRICLVDNCTKLYKLAIQKDKLINNEKKNLTDLYNLKQITESEYRNKYNILLNKSKNMKEFINLYNCEIEKCSDTLKNKLLIFISQILKKIDKNSHTFKSLSILKVNIENDKLSLEQREILYSILIKHIDDLFV